MQTPSLVARLRFVSTVTVVGLVAGCAASGAPAWVASSSLGMVASDSVYASRAGAEILRQGGNAIDAAVATSFALGVVRPYSTGLGGGGFMIYREARTGRLVALDFREMAPAASTPDMFVKAHRPGQPSPSQVGALAVAVPGLLMGQVNLLRTYGSRTDASDLAAVLAPAIRLAEKGFAVDQHYADACAEVFKLFTAHPALKRRAAYVWKTHLREGDLPQPGDRLTQPALARTLRLIAEQGAAPFYGGEIGRALIDTVRQDGGIMTLEDLHNYELRDRQPILSKYRDTQIISFGPPSSGGIALAETLNILETVDLAVIRESDPALAAHWTIEALKHAFADRARWLGDPDFFDVPVRTLLAKDYAKGLAARIRPDAVAPTEAYGGQAETPADRTASPAEDAGTSHFCVVDHIGNCVVWTETINTTFGSLLAVEPYGILLNNQMDDFSARPGEPNAFGLVQSPANAVAPGKRPLSSMSPTIVTRNGTPVLLVGGSGGPRIISSVLQTILNVVDYNLPIGRAVGDPRFHHQWRPDEVVFDAEPDPTTVIALQDRGHRVSPRRRGAVVQAIAIGPAQFTGVSDPRKGGTPQIP